MSIDFQAMSDHRARYEMSLSDSIVNDAIATFIISTASMAMHLRQLESLKRDGILDSDNAAALVSMRIQQEFRKLFGHEMVAREDL